MIVRRTLTSIQHCRNGTIFASFLAIDDKGREWRRSRSRFKNKAEAQTALEAYDWIPQLKAKQIQDSQEDIESGKLSSLTTIDFKLLLTKRLRDVTDELDHSVVIKNRLQAALDRING